MRDRLKGTKRLVVLTLMAPKKKIHITFFFYRVTTPMQGTCPAPPSASASAIDQHSGSTEKRWKQCRAKEASFDLALKFCTRVEAESEKNKTKRTACNVTECCTCPSESCVLPSAHLYMKSAIANRRDVGGAGKSYLRLGGSSVNLIHKKKKTARKPQRIVQKPQNTHRGRRSS